MDVRRGKERIVKSVMGRYTREQLQKEFGLKSPVVQGFNDMLDLNKLVKKVTPEQVKKLKEMQLNGNYGVQDNSTMRDVLLQSSKLLKDFSQLPAYLREHFGNDEFNYHKYLTDNKDNKYALAELQAKLSKSETLQRMINKQKQIEIEKQKEILEQNKVLAEQIAAALGKEQPK